MRKTFFAPAGRAETDVLQATTKMVAGHPIADAVLQVFGGMVVFLNEQRQIIAFNNTLLEQLGDVTEEDLLGMRVGEAFRCRHAKTGPDGCGTSKSCRTCGAAVAMVVALAEEQPVDRECLLSAERAGREESYEFLVRATPKKLGGETILIVTMRDVSERKKLEVVQHVFMHDLMNLMAGLQGMCLELRDHNLDELEEIVSISERVVSEISTQRDLLHLDHGKYKLNRQDTTLNQVLKELRSTFSGAPSAKGKTIEWPDATEEPFATDTTLLLRVLINMLKNALEATEETGVVRFSVERSDGTLTFHVWNPKRIPEDVEPRIFQRYFTTKPGTGRGLGTYSMRLMGERYLGGTVSFETSEAGTTFSFALPI